MRTRMEALPPSDKPGHVTIELEGHGPHHFRLPSFAQVIRLADFWEARPGTSRARVIEQGDVAIGVAWRHETLELEAEYPLEDPTDAALIRYSEAVLKELEEAGYTPYDVSVLASRLISAIRDRAAERTEAKALSDFSEARPASRTS